jgi:hypothetical protein
MVLTPSPDVRTRTYRDGSVCRLERDGDGWSLEYFDPEGRLKFRHRLFGDVARVQEEADRMIGLEPASEWTSG